MKTVAPYLARLEAEIAQCNDSARLARLLAHKAVYLARTGKFEPAEAIGRTLRRTFGAKGRAQAFCWIWIADGVLGYYRHGSGAHRTELERAHAMSASLGQSEPAQLAAAWLAHLSFVDWDFEGMVRWLKAAGPGNSTSPEAAARAALVLADAAQFAGVSDLADTWYRRVRQLALDLGDRALVVAVLENPAVVLLDRTWVAAAFGEVERDLVARLDDQIAGGLAYERATDSAALMAQTDVWRARILALQGRHDAALELLTRHPEGPSGPEISIVASRHALKAWLALQAGQPAKARHYYDAALRRSDEGMDIDDRAVCLQQLAAVSSAVAGDGRAPALAERARAAHAEYIACIDSLRRAIGHAGFVQGF
jgi:tetratricopeptide (TPR) repeat protein